MTFAWDLITILRLKLDAIRHNDTSKQRLDFVDREKNDQGCGKKGGALYRW